MKLISIIDEDFVNYKKPTFSILFPYCSMKCNKECGKVVCQNTGLLDSELLEVDNQTIIDRYMSNPLTQAICCYGMEPLDSQQDLFDFIDDFRLVCDDDIIIYTGYTEEEITNIVNRLRKYQNIIVKFGRYLPDCEPHYDEVLGVSLASPNQYAKRISDSLNQ